MYNLIYNLKVIELYLIYKVNGFRGLRILIVTRFGNIIIKVIDY